jgi:perosamine synthetase
MKARKDMIPLSVPNLKGNELKYVTEAIQTEWVSTGGSYIDMFEEKISNYLNTNGAVACQSGTAGIHLALNLLDITSEDEVIVPTLTFIAAVNPVSYVGASPLFMDCDDSLNMDLGKLELFLSTRCEIRDGKTINIDTNKHIKAVIIVHVFGNMANMEELMRISEKYNLKVVEDATEALGSYCISGQYSNCFAGTIGDIGVFSFNGNKIITSGGGGMLVAKSEKLLKRAKYLSTQAKNNPLFYRHDEIGYNYRMTNLQAAVGLAQLEQLEEFIEIKKKNYFEYAKSIQNIDGMKLLEFNEWTRPNYWFYSIILESVVSGEKLENIINELQGQGVQTRPVWGLIHMQKPYQDNGKYFIEKSLDYVNRVINIPCSTNLTFENVNRVVDALLKIRKDI